MLDSYFPMASQFACADGGRCNSCRAVVVLEPRKERAMQSRSCASVTNWIGAFALGLLFSIPAPQSRAQETVRIGVGVDPVFTAWWIAEEKGFYKKYGVKAEITQFSGGPALGDATMAGEADIGSSGTATWMPRIVRGSMVVLATMATSPDAFKMAARTSIKSLSDLQGKKVGTVGGSSTDYLWVLLAKKLNVAESAFDVIPMTPPELVPSLDRGDIQAYFVWEPWASRAVEVSGRTKSISWQIAATSATFSTSSSLQTRSSRKQSRTRRRECWPHCVTQSLSRTAIRPRRRASAPRKTSSNPRWRPTS